MIVTEVMVAFAAAHLCFRAFRRFTALGQLEVDAGWVLSPGLAFAAVALLVLCWRRVSPRQWGLRLDAPLLRVGTPGPAVAAGLIATAIVAALGALCLLLGVEHRPRALGAHDAALLSAGGLAATAALLGLLRRHEASLARARTRTSATLLVLLLALPTALAWWSDRAPTPVLAATAWRFLGAGVGEEIFFRGYVQSRLDGRFGRPWRFVGVAFGPGLPLAAALFALVHVLNPCDYFGGPCELAWWHGLAVFAMPYGFLFARTGSVVAPAVLHGLVNVLALLLASRPV